MALAALGFAAPLSAGEVAVEHSVFVEREVEAAGGRAARVLEPARELRRGDRLVYFVAWRAPEPRAESFTITNPLPRAVSYQRSADGFEEVSVDGGRSWGKLGDLRVAGRSATAEDVTHVRWQVPRQIALAGRGKLTWSGVVR
ncbi:MAG TPA: hypothetical protein VM055_05750 [Novosphingobium sp.]|nr:hypothetical protein [Novosphingobium sp.]